MLSFSLTNCAIMGLCAVSLSIPNEIQFQASPCTFAFRRTSLIFALGPLLSQQMCEWELNHMYVPYLIFSQSQCACHASGQVAKSRFIFTVCDSPQLSPNRANLVESQGIICWSDFMFVTVEVRAQSNLSKQWLLCVDGAQVSKICAINLILHFPMPYMSGFINNVSMWTRTLVH